jgi:hypothetical protein
MSLNLAGLAIGLPCAYAFARLLSSILYGVRASDALVFSGVPIALALIGLLACYVPARRAAALDPTAALGREWAPGRGAHGTRLGKLSRNCWDSPSDYRDIRRGLRTEERIELFLGIFRGGGGWGARG